MVACFRQGFVVLPCTEQLRAEGPARCGSRSRSPRLVVCRRAQRGRAARRPAGAGRRCGCPWGDGSRRRPPPPAELDARGPVPDHVHVRHRRRAEGRRCTASATSPASSCRPSTGSRPRPASSSGARRPRAGRSRRATRSSRRGCAAPRRCCTTRASTRTSAWSSSTRERVDVLCMAPTEYRVIAKRADAAPARRRCAASSPPARRSTPRSCAPGTRRPGLWIRDGYGQTETGQLTGMPLGETARARARWAARCRASTL